MTEPFPKSVRRLWIRLTIVWAFAWLIGLMVFALVTHFLATQYYDEQLDSRLRIQAIAVYGLAFFDESGQFESGLLKYDDALFEPTTGVWIVEPGATPKFHLSDDKRFDSNKLIHVAKQVVRTDQEFLESGIDEFGEPFRLLAIPTYDADSVVPRAAIIVANNPTQINLAKQQLLFWTVLAVVLTGLGGIMVGSLIASWSLSPLARFISQREQFLSAAAHELRTPLASISAVVESGNAENEPANQALNRLTPLVTRATECTDNLLLYARLDAGIELLTNEPIRLDLLIEAEAPEDGVVTLELDETIIDGDAKLLKAMIRNLFDNALRHATDPQNILVSLKERILCFENDGEVFPSEIISRQQEEFRLSPSSTGSGLGLAIVQRIVRLHGGKLLVSNTENNRAQVKASFES